MGNACSHPAFTPLELHSNNVQLITQLRERPELLCDPKPAALFGLNDTALHLAAEHELVDAAQQLFSFLAGADQDMLQAALRPYCRRKRLPLPVAFPAAQQLVANMVNNKGQTALMFACYRNSPEMVKLLLEQGADPWLGDNCGSRNALHYAAMAGSAACVEALMKHIRPYMLVRQGVRYINSRSLSGLTPLHYCIFFGREAALQQLLLYEPNINAASTGESYDTFGTYEIYSTPLHFAAFQDNMAISKLLLLHYARRRRLGSVLDPRMRANSAGKLPWQVARSGPLAAMLHPAAPLSEVLGREGEEALLGMGGGDQVARGPPTLAALAAAVLRQKLLAAVEVIERECVEEAALQRQQTSRAGGLLSCATPHQGGGGAPLSLFRLASRGLTRSLSHARIRRHAPGTVMPFSPQRAPTLDRLPHPSDLPATTAAGVATSLTEEIGSSGQQLPQQCPRGPPSGGATTTGRSSGNIRSRVPRAASGRGRGRQQPQGLQPQVWDTSTFLGGSGDSGDGGGAGGVGFVCLQPDYGLTPVANVVNGDLGFRSTSLTAGYRQPCTNGGGGGGGDAAGEISALLPGRASPASPYDVPRTALELPSGAVTPVGGSPIRDKRSGSLLYPGGGSGAFIYGNSDDGNRLTQPSYGGNLLSTATSLVAGSCGDFDTAAAAVVRGAAAAATIDEGCGGSDDIGNDLGDSDDDDGTCNVCFARQEAVMSATCQHGLCTACAGELCRALMSKPLLCPFCRRPVGTFVRMVKPAVVAATMMRRR